MLEGLKTKELIECPRARIGCSNLTPLGEKLLTYMLEHKDAIMNWPDGRDMNYCD